MANEYIENLGHKMGRLRIRTDMHNAIFVSKGRYHVRYISALEATFDEMVQRLLDFNKDNETSRCIMVKSPNRFLRGLEYWKRPKDFIGPMPLSTAMLTYCAPMKDKLPDQVGFKSQGRLDDVYLIPDRRQEAADMLSENDDMVEVANVALNLTEGVTMGNKVPFEGAPLYPKRS